LFSRLAKLALVALLAGLCTAPAAAIPIFAQRYAMKCSACHTVIPELNGFGNAFRNNGYQFPKSVQRHGTTLVAIRYQLEWDETPSSVDAPRFVPGGIVLANADIGKISAFLHYNLGAQGGPSGAFLAYLATANEHTHMLYRLGLFELPLVHSPGQRLDDLAAYGYEGLHVGLNDLTLSQPRLGLEAERQVGITRIMATAAIGEFKGAAYGGAPLPTGTNTRAAQPELGLFVRTPVTNWLTLTGDGLEGQREIFPTGRANFDDGYNREALGFDAHQGRVSLLTQQWWGHDFDDDGFGTRAGSVGGFSRLRYALDPGDHAYVGLRYDAQAAPLATRDTVLYGAILVNHHIRLLLENKHNFCGTSSLEGAVTIAAPWPLKE
jgi:hypothetical protein